MANLLLANRDASNPPFTVGINWVYNFVRRNPILKTRFLENTIIGELYIKI